MTPKLPPEWFEPPYAYHTFIGIARDQGHEPHTLYGDDGVLHMQCRRPRCTADLLIDRGEVRHMTLLDERCAQLVAVLQELEERGG